MRLIIDVDGVLADFNYGFARLVDLYEPGIVTPPITQNDARLTCWSWDQALGYSLPAITKAWAHVKASPDFWRTLAPYTTTFPDLIALQNTMAAGHEVYFVTARLGVYCKRQTEQWLRTYMPWGEKAANPTVVICKAKGLFARAIEADYIIDDKSDNLYDMPGHCHPYLFSRPWNHHDHTHIRVNTVAEMLRAVGVV